MAGGTAKTKMTPLGIFVNAVLLGFLLLALLTIFFEKLVICPHGAPYRSLCCNSGFHCPKDGEHATTGISQVCKERDRG